MINLIKEVVRNAYKNHENPEILVKEDYEKNQYIVYLNTEMPQISINDFSDIIYTILDNLEKQKIKRVDSHFAGDFYVLYLKEFEYEGT